MIVDRSKVCVATHSWIFLEDEEVPFKFHKQSEEGHLAHAEIWGNKAWDIGLRGYYNEEDCVITCHADADPGFLKRLERACDKAGLMVLYFKGWVRELQTA